jgi:protein-tyrosine kinase
LGVPHEGRLMSLIEQAAKRLEQLRRSGAALQEGPSRDGEPIGGTKLPSQPERTPTPEALVNELKARSARSAPTSVLRPRDTRAPEAAPSRVRTASGLIRERVQIDVARLHDQGFVTPDVPESTVAHEFRVIKRPILRNANGRSGTRIRNGNLLMVTSALPGEGKTFTATNLAISMAMEFDNTVLLVDGDVARPSLPGVLGLPSSPGLLDVLIRDDVDVDDVILETSIEKLTVLPAGSRDRRATELLASEKMINLLDELASRYSDRMIIFDSPPLLATTEAPVLATNMGQIVLVVAADTTSRHVVNQALATIERCEVVLMLLNKAVKPDHGAYYGYYADSVPL